jgi:hypothetical protein
VADHDSRGADSRQPVGSRSWSSAAWCISARRAWASSPLLVSTSGALTAIGPLCLRAHRALDRGDGSAMTRVLRLPCAGLRTGRGEPAPVQVGKPWLAVSGPSPGWRCAFSGISRRRPGWW